MIRNITQESKNARAIMRLLKNHQNLVANLLLASVAAIWGSTFFMIKHALDFSNALAFIFYRSAFSALILAVILFIQHKKIKLLFKNFRFGCLLGILLFMTYASQTIGICYTTAVNAGFIGSLAMLFIPIFNFIVWRKKPTLMNLLALAMATLGLWCITSGISGLNRGDLLNLLCAAIWAVYVLYADKVVKTKPLPFVLNFQQLLVMSGLCFLGVCIFKASLIITSQYAIYALIYLVVFASVIAAEMQFVAQRYTKPLNVAMILLLEPVFAAIFAWTLGDEAFSWLKTIGGLLIIAALTCSELPLRQKIPAESKI